MTGIDFPRWSGRVLHDATTRTLWTAICNLVFPGDTAAESKTALLRWAEENRIDLHWEPTVTPQGADWWVSTTHRRSNQ